MQRWEVDSVYLAQTTTQFGMESLIACGAPAAKVVTTSVEGLRVAGRPTPRHSPMERAKVALERKNEAGAFRNFKQTPYSESLPLGSNIPVGPIVWVRV